MGLARIDVDGADGLGPEHQGHAQEGDEAFLAGEVGVEIAGGSLDIEFLEGSFAADHDADEAFLDVDMGFFEIGGAGSVAGAELEPLPGVIEEEQGTHFGFHQEASLAGDDPECLLEVLGGVDGVADADQGLEQPGFKAQLFVEPGVVDDFGGLVGELAEQFLIGGGKGVDAIRVHIQDAADLAIDLERHGELGSHVGPELDIAGIGSHVAHSGGPAGAGDPAGDPFTHAESKFGGVRGDAAGGLDFEELGGGIEEGDGAAGGAHDADGFVDDQPEDLVGFEGGVDDLADLVEQAQAFVTRVEIDSVHRTRLVRTIPTMAKSPLVSQPARNGWR